MAGAIRRRWAATALVAAALLSGCGGPSRAAPTTSPAAAPRAPATPRSASRGAAGVRPGENLAPICSKLAASSVRALTEAGAPAPQGTPAAHGAASGNLTSCRLRRTGLRVRFSLDAAPDARQRYSNRIVESYQFGAGGAATSPGLRPRPGEGLGDRNVEGGGANWLPIYNQLLSVRGQRVLIVGIFVRGASDDQLKSAAIALSRDAYRQLHRGR